jgi:cell division protease FtsH
MNPDLGPIIYQKSESQVFLGREIHEDRAGRFSDETLESIDRQVRGLVQSCYERSRGILTEHRDLLDELATVLMEREVMEGHEFARIIRERLGDLAPPSTKDTRSPETARREAARREPGPTAAPESD